MVRERSIWLADVINNREYRVGAEVGAAIGITTFYVLSRCRNIITYIVADDWRPVPGSGIFEGKAMKERFLQRCSGFLSKINILEGMSWEQAQKVPDNSLDFCFIDASHDYQSVMKDLKAWKPKVKPGGMLCGHDVHWDGVKKALEDFGIDYELAGVDNVWYYLVKK